MIDQQRLKNQIKGYSGNRYSQLSQDVFVLTLTKFLKNGYFVEFGASDGITINNTFLLEKEYQWQGLCLEPIPNQYEKLIKNRKCHCDNRVIYEKSNNKVSFQINQNSIDESKIVIEEKNNNDVIEVETVTLEDALREYNAPKVIDYLSMDTEGTEYSIIKSFDFSKYDIKIITIEHNYIENNRKNIYDYLTKLGYIRILEKKSKHDDWYIKSDVIDYYQ